MSEPIIEKARGISPIWLLPLLALGIGAWLFYQSQQSKGIEITIRFKDVSGISPGKTQVIYKGLPVGLVKHMQVNQEAKAVDVLVRMESMAKHALVEDTKFWVVRPEISTDRIQGLDTLFSGNYITAQPGSSDKQSRSFIALPQAPPLPHNTPGLHLTLQAESLGSLQAGSRIYYRNIDIGSVQSVRLVKDATVDLDIHIQEEFSHLVREGSRFWNASGITATGGLSGVKIHMESLNALLRGGIAMETPDSLKDGPAAHNGQTFPLHKDFAAAKYGISITLQLATGEGIVEGSTKVMYRGMQAGIVQDVKINQDAEHSVTASILLDPRAEGICREGTRFWMVKPQLGLNKIEHLDTLVTGPYLTFSIGTGSECKHFNALQTPPPAEPLRPGTTFTLQSDNPIPLSPGAPVLHKTIEIGQVLDTTLEKNGSAIQISIFIFDEYTELIKKSTVFHAISAMEMEASIHGVSLHIASANALLSGGIECLTPDNPAKPVTATAQDRFILYSSRNEAIRAVPALQPLGLPITITATELGSISRNSPVLYKQIPIGSVTGFRLADNHKDVLIEVLILPEYTGVLSTASRFFNISPIRIEGSLQQGIALHTSSLAVMAEGGIACFTPEGGKKLQQHQSFPLFAGEEEARLADSPRLVLRTEASHGLQKGSPLRFEGVTIGKILDLELDIPLHLVTMELAVEPRYRELFREESRIWLVEPQAGILRTKNLDTILTGPYLAVRPGSGKLRNDFVLLTEEPPPVDRTGGLHLVLESAQAGSLQAGAPIFFRQMKVGAVQRLELAQDYSQVLVEVMIEPEYRQLIRQDTRFWHSSGIRVNAGLFEGVEVAAESVETLLTGGIALAGPPDSTAPVADNGARFPLHAKAEKAWLTWHTDPVTAVQNK